MRDAAGTQAIDNALNTLTRIMKLGGEWQTILEFSLANRCLRSESERTAISRVLKSHVPTDVQAELLGGLLTRVEAAGYKFHSE